jgi:hypothetical protein
MIAEASPEEIQRDIIEAELYNLGIDPESIRSPLQSTKTRKTSGFGQRTLRGETKMHTGIDLVSSNNQNLVAMSDGIVCRQFARPLRLLMNEGYGHQFIGTMDINGAPHTYEYSHTEKTALEEFRQSKTVEREDLPEHLKAYVDCREVEKGTELGIMGNTGSSTGTHLHAEIRDATRKRINPETIFTHLVDLNVLEEEIRESDEEDSTES